ncbi:MAG: [Lachnospiraceae bacterium]|nr:[FeFe] hydrogenase H-cluster maturation GTPase HydF [Lachnospiraceae bacterium]
MGLNDTPSANRIHIGFFGMRNAGKSSLVNAITNQRLSVVSDTKGTTTDPVYKSMELLPLGPVLIMDTPGIDDEGELGRLRMEKTRQVLEKTDMAILVIDAEEKEHKNYDKATAFTNVELDGKEHSFNDYESALIDQFKKRELPYLIVYNKCDITGSGDNLTADKNDKAKILYVSSKTGEGIEQLKERMAHLIRSNDTSKPIVGDLLKPMDIVILVIPIDSSAPKGRLILPQQQVIRDILEAGAVSVVVKDTELADTLDRLSPRPYMVITDSQAFGKVSQITPEDIYLTSFSILMARWKGFLEAAVNGAMAIENISEGDNILIAEGCTHHRQCEDIGTVKLPNLIRKYTGVEPVFTFTSGGDYPEELSRYKLIIQCGGCMLNEKAVRYRMNLALSQGVPFTNYGTAIAKMNGILDRSIEIVKDRM